MSMTYDVLQRAELFVRSMFSTLPRLAVYVRYTFRNAEQCYAMTFAADLHVYKVETLLQIY